MRSLLFSRLLFRRVHTYKKPTDVAKDPKKPTVWNLVFGKYLLTTNTVSSGILMMLGDVMAQKIEHHRGHRKKELDWYRIGCMTLVGISQGPLHHYLYKWMDVWLPGASLRTVFKKILMDQFVMSPIFIITYLYSAGVLEGSSVQHCTNELVDKFPTIYVADWAIWPPMQFLNFYLLSPKHRVLYINVITMLYNVFLCYIKHNDDLRISLPHRSTNKDRQD